MVGHLRIPKGCGHIFDTGPFRYYMEQVVIPTEDSRGCAGIDVLDAFVVHLVAENARQTTIRCRISQHWHEQGQTAAATVHPTFEVLVFRDSLVAQKFVLVVSVSNTREQ
jgi:hypothetical protein